MNVPNKTGSDPEDVHVHLLDSVPSRDLDHFCSV